MNGCTQTTAHGRSARLWISFDIGTKLCNYNVHVMHTGLKSLHCERSGCEAVSQSCSVTFYQKIPIQVSRGLNRKFAPRWAKVSVLSMFIFMHHWATFVGNGRGSTSTCIQISLLERGDTALYGIHAKHQSKIVSGPSLFRKYKIFQSTIKKSEPWSRKNK